MKRKKTIVRKNRTEFDEYKIRLLGKRIRKCRNEKKITRSELASKTGVTEQTIAKIESDKVDSRTGKQMCPSVETLYAIAKVLGVSVDYLLTGRSRKPEELRTLKDADLLIAKLVDKQILSPVAVSGEEGTKGKMVFVLQLEILKSVYRKRWRSELLPADYLSAVEKETTPLNIDIIEDPFFQGDPTD